MNPIRAQVESLFEAAEKPKVTDKKIFWSDLAPTDTVIDHGKFFTNQDGALITWTSRDAYLAQPELDKRAKRALRPAKGPGSRGGRVRQRHDVPQPPGSGSPTAADLGTTPQTGPT